MDICILLLFTLIILSKVNYTFYFRTPESHALGKYTSVRGRKGERERERRLEDIFKVSKKVSPGFSVV